ncbi:hypothetical protein BU17DRAFT_62295 [Hysterangium stoloniferum]|nr:hypothetical protein BU17DRAFT_62295 [Hysterangium stoloniferum]
MTGAETYCILATAPICGSSKDILGYQFHHIKDVMYFIRRAFDLGGNSSSNAIVQTLSNAIVYPVSQPFTDIPTQVTCSVHINPVTAPMHRNYTLTNLGRASESTGQRLTAALRSITASISLYSQFRQLQAVQPDSDDAICETLKAVENMLRDASDANALDEEVQKHIIKELEEVRKKIKHITGRRGQPSNLLEKISEAARSLQDVRAPAPIVSSELASCPLALTYRTLATLLVWLTATVGHSEITMLLTEIFNNRGKSRSYGSGSSGVYTCYLHMMSELVSVYVFYNLSKWGTGEFCQEIAAPSQFTLKRILLRRTASGGRQQEPHLSLTHMGDVAGEIKYDGNAAQLFMRPISHEVHIRNVWLEDADLDYKRGKPLGQPYFAGRCQAVGNWCRPQTTDLQKLAFTEMAPNIAGSGMALPSLCLCVDMKYAQGWESDAGYEYPE